MLYMSVELEPVKNLRDFIAGVEALYEDPGKPTAKDSVVVSDIGGGLLKFVDAVFTGTHHGEIFAKHYIREPEGRGAHFDVYGDNLQENYPFLAVYNLIGRVSLKALKLPDDLAESYFKRFPEPNEGAFQARRDYSSIVLNSEPKDLCTADLDEGNGLVILQKPEGPHIIHDIAPKDPNNPGELVKLVCPDSSEIAKRAVEADGMVPLDELVTSALISETRQEQKLSFVVPGDGDPIAPSSDCGPGLLD